MPGVNALHKSIIERSKTLSHMGEKVPKSYMVIADTISALAKQKKEKVQSKYSINVCNSSHIPTGQLVDVKEVLDALPPFECALIQRDPQLLTRALKLLHEWAQCVYFDVQDIERAFLLFVV
jgi:hypothetical protein